MAQLKQSTRALTDDEFVVEPTQVLILADQDVTRDTPIYSQEFEMSIPYHAVVRTFLDMSVFRTKIYYSDFFRPFIRSNVGGSINHIMCTVAIFCDFGLKNTKLSVLLTNPFHADDIKAKVGKCRRITNPEEKNTPYMIKIKMWVTATNPEEEKSMVRNDCNIFANSATYDTSALNTIHIDMLLKFMANVTNNTNTFSRTEMAKTEKYCYLNLYVNA